MNKIRLVFVVMVSFITFISCSKDTFFSFCISSDYDPESYYSHDYTTKGDIIFGQYHRVGGGYLHGIGCGMNKTYRGLPEGEIIAFWHSFKYHKENEKKKAHPETETFYYAYDPDMKLKIPSKGGGHRKYTAFLSYGRFAIRPEAIKDKDLTDIPYAETFSDIKFYQMGEIDKLYVKIYSYGTKFESIKLDCINMTPPSELYEIQAIEITQDQFDYCMNNEDVILNEKVPGFTEKQKIYMDERRKEAGESP